MVVCACVISLCEDLSAARVYTNTPLGKKTIQNDCERIILPLHPYKALMRGLDTLGLTIISLLRGHVPGPYGYLFVGLSRNYPRAYLQRPDQVRQIHN
jgi:hypothetical protein